MNLYDYVFYRIYKSLNISNKSIPEWSTTFTISTVIFFNLFSLFIFLDYSIKSLGEPKFKVLTASILIFHYFYFLFKNRYLRIIDKFEKSKFKKNIYHDIIVVVYICLSIFVFFDFLKIEILNSLILIGLILISSIYSFMKIKK